MFRRDLATTQKSDPKYAERLRRTVATRFLDTNEFSLLDVPADERLLIGAATTRRLGSGHNPDVARAALEQSRREVESLLSGFSVVVLIGTGGKGTGAGTLFPLAQMARAQNKLVIPVYVRPSFERHEVEKPRYDHALTVSGQFDAAGIRLVEILNDRGYVESDPQPQSVVWERMNRPMARGLRGLLYVLSDLSQVDPSDLSVMFAGQGRLRIGFSEIDASYGHDPTDEQVQQAVLDCWDNPYCGFDGAVGTSLICVQGDWSNVVDANIKSRFAALAHGGTASSPYNPLYARALRVPKPWGVTAILAEFTGNHPPLQIEWRMEERPVALVSTSSLSAGESTGRPPRRAVEPPPPVVTPDVVHPADATGVQEQTSPSQRASGFTSFRDFALALNRSEPGALVLARDGANDGMAIEVTELRKLLTTFWVRSLFPRFSSAWRDRMLNVLVQNVAIPNCALRLGRRSFALSEASHDDLKQVVTETIFPDAVRNDLQLLIAVGTLWGEDALRRFEFTRAPEDDVKPSRLGSLLHAFRSTPSSEAAPEDRH
jgi:cell division GTPase FtsZ